MAKRGTSWLIGIIIGSIPVMLIASTAILISADSSLTTSTSTVPTAFTTRVVTTPFATTILTTTSYSPPIVHSGGTSVISIMAVNSAGQPVDRMGYNMFMELRQNGVVIKSCNAPCQFTVIDGQTYQVNPGNWGPEIFSHWKNDGSNDYETVNVPKYNTTINLVAIYNP